MNYFDNRKICTKIGKQFSSLKDSKYGVPQGSCLGPLLFILYINDLMENEIVSKIVVYADDIMIYFIHKEKTKIAVTLQNDMDKIVQWTIRNDLFINTEKTKVMWMCNEMNLKARKERAKKIALTTTGGNEIFLEEVLEYKYLGLTIDRFYKWQKHVLVLRNKLRGIWFRLVGVANKLNENMKKIVYSAMVKSVIEYGLELYIDVNETEMNKLEKMHRKIIKQLGKNDQNANSDIEKYSKLRALPITQMFVKKYVIENYKKIAEEEYVKNRYETKLMEKKALKEYKYINKYDKRKQKFKKPRILNQLLECKICSMSERQIETFLTKHLLNKNLKW